MGDGIFTDSCGCASSPRSSLVDALARSSIAGFHATRPDHPAQNHLLASLGGAGYREIVSSAEGVPLTPGLALHESEYSPRYVYFPTSGIVCGTFELESGATSEVTMVGNEGMVGLPILTGGESMPYRSIVLSPGYAYRVSSAVLKSAISRGGPFQKLLFRYLQALMTLVAQTAACNRHHQIEQQLCRWLLMCLDRLPSSKLATTHGLIGDMLGVRRESVTEAASRLQACNIIHYSRGHITVLDRAKLEASACECYCVVRREYQRLFPEWRALRFRRQI